MSKMRNAILNAVMFILMDDDLQLHELIQYIVTDLLSDNLKIVLPDDDVETSEELINCSVPNNPVNQNTTEPMLLDLWTRILEFENRKVEILHELIQLMTEHNRIQQEKNNILKRIIEMDKMKSDTIASAMYI